MVDKAGALGNSGLHETPIDHCDVHDKNGLTRHRELRKKWLAWLQADPNHPIWSQLFKIAVNDLAVRTLAAAAENDPQSPLHNPLLVRTILEGHQDAQILGIRRLWDNDSKVISVRRLLKDLRANLDVFTREIYVSGSGLSYDPNPGTLIASVRDPGFVSPSSPILSVLQTEKAQQRFDRLSKFRQIGALVQIESRKALSITLRRTSPRAEQTTS
jgi:AbiU2